jgi:hypothetical protein
VWTGELLICDRSVCAPSVRPCLLGVGFAMWRPSEGTGRPLGPEKKVREQAIRATMLLEGLWCLSGGHHMGGGWQIVRSELICPFICQRAVQQAEQAKTSTAPHEGWAKDKPRSGHGDVISDMTCDHVRCSLH